MKIFRQQPQIAFLVFGLVFCSIILAMGAIPAGNVRAQNCDVIEEGVGGSVLTIRRAIVPCGRSCDESDTTTIDETAPCTLCHLLIMAKNIVDLLFAWLIIVALIMLTIAGVLYIVSIGNRARTALAKYIVEKTLGGFALFLLSWLLVYTILVVISANENRLGLTQGTDSWFEFSCDTTSSYGAITGVPGGPGGPGPGPVTPEQEQAVRDRLAAAGVLINNPSPITQGGGLRENTIQGVIDFQNEFGGTVVITGGSESGPHSGGTYSHANGYKVDFRDTPAVNNYIENNYTYVGTRSDGAPMYRDGHGNTYARESTHWDVCYNCG